MDDQEVTSDRIGSEIGAVLMAGRGSSTNLRDVEIGIVDPIPTGPVPPPSQPALSETDTNSNSNATEAATEDDESGGEYNSKNLLYRIDFMVLE
jgi:hypothetical protein